jgi:putative Holliday junction resolvase
LSKVIAIDYGKARIGVAISDERAVIALPLKNFQATSGHQKMIEQLIAFLSTLQYTTIVVGLPLLMNGKDSDITKEVRAFAALLEAKLAKPIVLWDERLTSKQAEKLLSEGAVKRKDRTKKVDTMAALLILQSYLDSKNNS